VVDGKVSAVFNPAKPDVEIQQSSIASYKALQSENAELRKQLSGINKNFEGLQKEFTAFKKNPLEDHTVITPEEETTDKDYTYFANQPWNKRKQKKAS